MSNATIIYILSIIGTVTRETVYPYSNAKQATQAAYNKLTEAKGKLLQINDIQILDKNIMSVDGELFKIFRPKGWTRHDVKHIGNVNNIRT